MAVKKKQPKGKAVSKATKKEVSTNVIDFSADAGKGLENADASSYAIPFFGLLQGLSPQVVDEVVGAKPGIFFNSVTNDFYGKEVRVIPCSFQRRYLAWASRDDGGGFKGSYSPLEVEGNHLDGLSKNEEGRHMIGDDLLVDTRIHYILVEVDEGVWKPMVWSLSKTQLKKSKQLMALIAGLEMEHDDGSKYNPASFSHTYLVSSIKEENEKGKWYGVTIEVDEQVDDAEVYQAAKKFSQEANEGNVKVAEPKTDEESETF